MAPPSPSLSTARSCALESSAELDLADRARAGDSAALAELYRRLSGGLCRHATRMLRDEAAARDVVQEAFLRALGSIAQTRPELRFRAWIYRIATNLCLRELTGRVRTGPEVEEPCAPERGAPDRDELQRGRARVLEEALAALPDRQREILLLREVEELSYEELATVLGLSLANVKVSLHRARGRFAAELLARQVLANHASFEGACEEGLALKSHGAGRALARHLEACERCRRGARSAVAELVALSPPIPLAPPAWPAASPASAEAGSGAAPAPAAGGGALGGAGLAAGWVVALVAGALLATGVATAALFAKRRATPTATARGAPGPAEIAGASAVPRRSATANASVRASSPAASAGKPSQREQRGTRPVRSLRGASTRGAPARAPARVPQVGDPEDAP